MVFANWREKKAKQTSSCRKQCPLNRVSANYLSTFQKVFYESLTRISPGKIKSSANQRCPLFRVSVNWKQNYSIFTPNLRNLKPLKKWLAASVNSRIDLLSPNHLKTSGFFLFSGGQKEWPARMKLLIQLHYFKALGSFKFQSFNVHSLAFSVQSPGSSVQSPTLVSRVQEFRYAMHLLPITL